MVLDRLPDASPDGPAREWLERERWRADPSAHGSVSARLPEAKKERGADWRFRSLIMLLVAAAISARNPAAFITSPRVGWGLVLPFGAAAFFVYQYAVREKVSAYRQRRRPDRADALEGGGSDD
ncbi:MAG: hypothetical protein F4Z70_12625 [Acidimicrobiia bacterium]|nr:hypothetical protein [Acidimicrobiia bacterium]